MNDLKSSTPKKPTAVQIAEGLVMSIGEARKLLGADAKDLDDDQIAILLIELEELAHHLIKYKQFVN
jgi:hypothetical protein